MMEKKHGIFFGIAVLLISVVFVLAACDNPAGGGGGNDDESKSPIGIWTGTWTGNTSSSIELKIASDKFNFSGMGTRDEGTWYQSGDRITFTSTMGTGELGWATIAGNKMTFNVTLPLFVALFKCTGGQLTKTGSIEPLPSAKTIIISGFPAGTYSGNIAMLMLLSSMDDDDLTAMGAVSITSTTTLTIPLKTDTSLKTDWKGTGNYIVILVVADSEGDIIKGFAYTNGIEPNYSGSNIPTYPITQATTTLAFNTFRDITDSL